MKLKEINVGKVFAASGTLNFFGNGWWYHFWYKLLFPGFRKLKECTFISKTTTWYPRTGNMSLRKNLQPKALLPDCIKVYPFKGIALNSVGLSGPGAEALFASQVWQKMEKPFFISFMPVGAHLLDRYKETKKFINLFKKESSKFNAPVGIQVNISCPNTERKLPDSEDSSMTVETITILKEFAKLNVPIDLKVNVFFNIDLLKTIDERKLCDVITMSNTIPFGSECTEIDWTNLFPDGISPIKKYGGGGLSGKVILPVVLRKIKEMRYAGIKMPIKGGGGIMCPNDVDKMKAVGADAIEFATVAMLRPWRVKKIIKRAEEIF
jgi:dihydroorotate dehydrogenase